MEKIGFWYWAGILFSLFLIGYAIYWLYIGTSPEKIPEVKITDWIGKRRFTLKDNGQVERFDLLDPETAPPQISEKVMLGYNIFNETQKYALQYAGDKVTCNNCHLYGGNTFGGENGGISLVGVTGVYPKYSEREGRMINLKERLNNCFERSLNGRPLPFDSPEMEALIEYLAWISSEVTQLKDWPWLGLEKIESHHIPNPDQGALVYQTKCSLCHGTEGQGSRGIPPVWGSESFNDGAGMHDLDKLASFVWYNMPYQEPAMTQEEALDVAAFIVQQPRPHFDPQGQRN